MTTAHTSHQNSFKQSDAFLIQAIQGNPMHGLTHTGHMFTKTGASGLLTNTDYYGDYYGFNTDIQIRTFKLGTQDPKLNPIKSLIRIRK